MLSCCGFRKRKSDDREPLLPQYNDETTLQTELHKKLHTYQMLRALTQGYMPSTEQTIIHLRTLLASDMLNPRDVELSDSGRLLVKFTRRWLQQLMDLLAHKADKDQIQELLWHVSQSRVKVDTTTIVRRAQSSKIKANATAAAESLNTVASLLFANTDFRIFLSDLSTMLREVMQDTAQSVARVADDTAQRIESAAEPGNDLTKTNGKIDAPEAAELTTDLQVVTQAVAQGAAQVASEAEASAEEKLKGDEGQVMLNRLKAAVGRLRKRPDYSQSVSVLTIVAQRVIKAYSRVAEDTVNAVEDAVEENPEFDEAVKNFWLLLKSFGDGEEWDKLEDRFKDLVGHLENDPQLESSLHQIAVFVQKVLTDPEFLDNADAKLRDLRKQLHENEKDSSISDDLEAFLRQAEHTLRLALQDTDVINLVATSSHMLDILSPTNSITNPDLIRDSINVFIPSLINAIQHIPIPRLEVSTPEIDLLLENLIIEPGRTVNNSSFLPYRLRIETYNDLELRKARFAVVSRTSHLMTIKLDGLSLRADELGFWLRAHAGFFHLADEGIFSLALDERGMDIHLDVEICRNNIANILTLKEVRVHIHKLSYAMRKSKFSWLAWLIKPLLRPLLRKTLEKQLASAVAEFFHAANRELCYARERLRATRVADPGDLMTFVKAVLARWTPEEDPDVYTRVGLDEPGQGVFKGVYAPGSVVKVWHEEALEAEERIEEGAQARGWRNEVFDLQVANFT